MSACSFRQNELGHDANSCPKCGKLTLIGRRIDAAKEWRRVGVIGLVVFGLYGVIGGFTGVGGLIVQLLLSGSVMVLMLAKSLAEWTTKD